MLEYVFAPGTANETTYTEDVIQSHDPVKTHTGKGDGRVTMGVDISEVIEFAQRQDRVNIVIDGVVEWTGYVVSASHSRRSGQSVLRLDGIAKKLEETRPDYANLGGSLTYTDIALDDAISDYWGRTPFGNFSVTSQSTETVATDSTIQNADTTTELNNILSIPDTTALFVENGKLKRARSSFFQEAENASDKTVTSTQSGADASNGQYVIMTDSLHQVAETFTLDYTIQASNVGAYVRYRTPSGQGPEFEVQVDGNTVISFADEFSGATDWTTFTNTGIGSDLTSGSHTVKATHQGSRSTDDDIEVDAIAFFDDQFTYNFDNTVDANGYLAGPENYPSAEQIAFANETVSYNVTDGTINITANDTSNGQFIQLSFDGGSTWVPTDGSEDNTSSVTASSNTAGREIRGRAALDGFGTRTTATPTDKYQGQEIDVWELLASGNNLVVIDDLELSRNHFDNLQTLHNYGDFQWTIEHDSSSIANMTVVSYLRGDETRPQPDGFDKQINQNPSVDAQSYYNSIYLQGAQDENGDRPTAELKDQTAISNDGREISPGVLRDLDVTTEAGATFRARSLLNAASKRNNLRGTVTVPPNEFAHPGYAYPVDFTGDGSTEDKIAEQVALTEDPENVEIRYDFTVQSNISEQIEALRQNAREASDKL